MARQIFTFEKPVKRIEIRVSEPDLMPADDVFIMSLNLEVRGLERREEVDQGAGRFDLVKRIVFRNPNLLYYG